VGRCFIVASMMMNSVICMINCSWCSSWQASCYQVQRCTSYMSISSPHVPTPNGHTCTCPLSQPSQTFCRFHKSWPWVRMGCADNANTAMVCCGYSYRHQSPCEYLSLICSQLCFWPLKLWPPSGMQYCITSLPTCMFVSLLILLYTWSSERQKMA
jgi:hypothetical protein